MNLTRGAYLATALVTMEVNHGTDAATTPNTYSVPDLRLHVDLGYRF